VDMSPSTCSHERNDKAVDPAFVTRSVHLACQSNSQQCFFLVTNQNRPSTADSQQYFSLTANQHQPPATASQIEQYVLMPSRAFSFNLLYIIYYENKLTA